MAGGDTDTTGLQRKTPNRCSCRSRGGRADSAGLVVGKDVTRECLLRLVEKRDMNCETQSFVSGT